MLSSALVCVAQTLAGAYTHKVGRENEDAYLLLPEQVAAIPPKGFLVIMLDGISSGGHGAAAAQAARAAIQVRWSMVAADDTRSDPLELIYQLASAAQKAVLGRIEGGRGGTTCLLVLIRDGLLTFGHIGDCQLFQRRVPGGFVALTQDQTALLRTQRGRELKRSVEQSQQRGDPISDQQFMTYAQLENTLTRYLGKPDLPPDPRQWVEIGQAQLNQGDLFLLCTDGLLKARTLADLDRDLVGASVGLVNTLLAWIDQHYQEDRDDTTLCLIEVRAPLPAATGIKAYVPTFLPFLGEEGGGVEVRRSHYATITEQISVPVLLAPPPASASPVSEPALLDALLDTPLPTRLRRRWPQFWLILIVMIICLLLVGIMVSSLR